MKGHRHTLWILCLLLAACGSTVRNIPAAKPGDPRVSSPAVPGEEYRIQPGDMLDIKFFYSPELNEQMPVRPDGRIALQLAEEIQAAGLTPGELTTVLKEKYSRELRKPDVVVIVRTFGNQRIYVDGEVSKPGLFPLTGPTTVLQAIAQAGGFVYTGNTTDVVVIRRGAENQPVAMLVNMEKVYDGTDMGQDIYLRPFDIVYVPKTAIANANLWIEQYLTRMVPRIGFTYAAPAGSGFIGVDTTSTFITPIR
jgi:protein involved in polysaccharide export with SLBB domain